VYLVLPTICISDETALFKSVPCVGFVQLSHRQPVVIELFFSCTRFFNNTYANNMVNTLPLDLQQVICRHAIGPLGNDPFALVALRVNKSWAYFVCRVLYRYNFLLIPKTCLSISNRKPLFPSLRHYHIKNYLTFIGFVKTVTSPSPILPYGQFIRSIDLTPVNKYGIDMRAHRLMRCCPHIVEMTLGHPTTLKSETIREIAKYNNRLHTLSMGGIESFPFMLECDFSRLYQLQHVTLKTTPILASSFMTLPSRKLKSMRLIQMDAVTPQELLMFCQSHPKLQSLTIVNCKALGRPELGEVLAKVLTMHDPLANHELNTVELMGPQITDESLNALFEKVPKGARLKRLKLANTNVTRNLMVFQTHQNCLQVENLELVNNHYLQQ
jgi:hypothetical protein